MVSLVTWEAMPQPLPSPTLTNPDMILPDLDQSLDTAASTPLHTPRPLSPRSHLLKQGFRLDNPPLGRRRASSRASAASSTYSRRLDDDASGDGETTPKSLNPQGGNALAHEQRLNGAPRMDVIGNWQQDMNRKSSSTPDSVRSRDVDALRWAGFDTTQDDDAVSLADSEWRHRLSYISTGDDTDNEQWSSGDDEASNSAALSKRAEAILANAKKRLNVMEGNLRGARQSLMPTSTTTYSVYRPNNVMTSQPYATREGEAPRYFGLSRLPPRQRSFRSAPHNSSGNPGHSRGYSEINVSSENLAQAPPIKEKRATSALASTRGRWTPPSDKSGDARAAGLRGTRSHEAMRTSWSASDYNPSRYGHEASLPSPSLETLREDEDAHPGELRRSASTTSDLRAHMNDLKGRISSLKDRAREDRLKRSSIQNLRTPSPFAASELWYSGADAYKQHASANGGVAFRTNEALRRGIGGVSALSSPVSPGFPRQEQTPPESYQGSHYEDAEEAAGEEIVNVSQEKENGSDELDDSADSGEEEDEREIDADSLYDNDQEFHDAQVTTERHEDRADAFDYEHFFLHSAMGSYRKRASSASSAGSEGSVETTRAISPVRSSEHLRELESSQPSHRRTKSQESVSTLATFATATEGFGSDDESDNEALESFTRQAFGRHGPPALLDADSALGKQSLTDNGYRQSLLSPTPSVDSVQEYHNDPAARIMTGFFTPTKTRGRLTPLGQKDEDLLYALTTSIQQVVSRLQNMTEDGYETRVWRGRLDQARKILDGVPSEEV